MEEETYPRRLFPGFFWGLAAGVWVMWSYSRGAREWVPDDMMEELWVRVPTFTAALGLGSAFVVSEVVGRWRVEERGVWYLIGGLPALLAGLSAGATLLGGAYFGSMSIPYVGEWRLGLGIAVPLLLFSLSLARQQGAGWIAVLFSTLLWGGFVPSLAALLIAPFVSLRAVRELERVSGLVPVLIALGLVVGVVYGLTLALHVLSCRWWSNRIERQ